MSALRLSTHRLISIVVLTTLLAACGQKGPLLLPDKQTDDAKRTDSAKPANSSSAKPTTEKQLSTEPTSTKPDNIE